MIRKATEKDASRIAEINVASWRFAYRNIVPESYLYSSFLVEDRIQVFRGWIKTNRYDIYVYEDPESKVIKGMMGFGRCEDDGRRDAFELHFLYVEPAFSGAGIGSEMIRFFEQCGKKAGCSELVIWVLEDNEIGINCYRKNGYHCDGSEKMYQRLNKKEIRFVKAV